MRRWLVLADGGEERLNLVQHVVLVALPGEVIGPRYRDHASARDPLAHVARGGAEVLLRAVDHERRDADGCQHGANVDLVVHPTQGQGRAWAGAADEVGGVPANGFLVIGDRRRTPA